MLDIEVVLVVEDGDELLVQVGGGDLVVVAIRRDGNRLEIDLVRHLVWLVGWEMELWFVVECVVVVWRGRPRASAPVCLETSDGWI